MTLRQHPQRQNLNSPSLPGQDEIHFVELPIAILQHQQPKDAEGQRPDELVSVVTSFDDELGRDVPRKLTRRTSSRHGFPTALEDDVLIALLTLTKHRGDLNSPRVEFCNAELFNLMRWPQNGTSGSRLSVALDRLAGLTLRYDNSWTTEDGAFEKQFTTGLLESYSLKRQTRGRRKRNAERSWVQWASGVFADLQRGNVKELNTDRYYSLNLAVSKRLYRFLDLHLSRSTTLEIPLKALAAHLGLADLNHIGKIKERLNRSLPELEAIPGFLQPRSRSDRYAKRGPGDWLARFERPGKVPIPGTAQSVRASSSTRMTDEPATHLVTEFYRRWSGVENHTPTTRELSQARSVMDRLGEERTTELLKPLIRRMKQAFPAAKVFGATMVYWEELNQRHRPRSPSAISQETERDSKADPAERLRRECLTKEWHSLNPARQEAILQSIRKKSDFLERLIATAGFDDPLVRIHCLQELDRQQTG